jgi:hypothetical protein
MERCVVFMENLADYPYQILYTAIAGLYISTKLNDSASIAFEVF